MAETNLRRRVVRGGLDAAGQFARCLPRVRQLRRGGLAVFIFHDVSESPGGFARDYALAVAPGLFTRQIDWIARHFQPIHPDDLLRDRALPRDAALITFDDGFAGQFCSALPILEERKIPALLFLNMGVAIGELLAPAIAAWLGRSDPRFADFAERHVLAEPEYLHIQPRHIALFEAEFGRDYVDPVRDYQGEFADRKLLAAWQGHQLFCFGNHLFNHWYAPGQSETELRGSYLANEQALSELGGARPLFAFPHGRHDQRSVRIVAELGARRLFTGAPRINANSGSLLLDRINLDAAADSAGRLWFAAVRSEIAGLLPARLAPAAPYASGPR